jgi:predicted phosphodiesterase
MRILLLSDTHGDLSWINDRAEETGADAVIHAGDFGFYDEESPERLSDRELALRIVHSPLPEAQKRQAFSLSREERLEIVKRKLPLSELPEYLSGERRFRVPVYAVWGNHEDIEVIRALREGRARVENLHLLDERAVYRLGGVRLFGLGGNFLADTRLFDAPPAGSGGKAWATLSQFARLFERLSAAPAAPVSLFVSHVSPGKDALVRHLAAKLGADFLVSGHMGTPYCCVWSEFAVRDTAEAEAALERGRARVRAAWEEVKARGRGPESQPELVEAGASGLRPLSASASEQDPTGAEGERRPELLEEQRLLRRGLELLESAPEKRLSLKRGESEPAWYRGAFAINLPDAKFGYAVLTEDQGLTSLETYSRGRRFR